MACALALAALPPSLSAVRLWATLSRVGRATEQRCSAISAKHPRHYRTVTPAAARARGPAPAMRTLLAFDFDWSLCEENSDTFVIRQLGADALYEASKGVPWTQRMNRVLKEAAAQLGRTPDDVLAALRRTPLHASLADLLREAAAAGDVGGSTGVDVAIVSDANTVYIETILEHHSLTNTVLEVHTNPAEWRDGALRVGPYHSTPHGCPHCPANLCKGQVMQQLVRRQAAAGRTYDRVLYVGDGRGDFCPSILLLHGASGGDGTAPAYTPTPTDTAGAASAGGASDAGAGSSSGHEPLSLPWGASGNVVFAREEYPDGLPCALWVMLRAEQPHSAGEGGAGGQDGAAAPTGVAGVEAEAHKAGPRGCCGVVGWKHPEQLAALIRQELRLDA